jgi:transposase
MGTTKNSIHDKRDAGELCYALDRHRRGQDKALSVVPVPTEEQEENRAPIRYNRQIFTDRGRCEARGKACCVLQASKSMADGGSVKRG